MARVLDRGGPHRRRRIAAAVKLGAAAMGGRGLGFAGERGPASMEDRASEIRTREGGRAWHGSQGWPARGSEMAGGDACSAGK